MLQRFSRPDRYFGRCGHLDAAENKVEALTIKKLTKGNPTVSAMIEEARAKKSETDKPDEQ